MKKAEPKKTRKSPDKALIDDAPVVEKTPEFSPELGQLCWLSKKGEEPWLGSVESTDPLVVVKHTRQDSVHRTEEVAVDLADYSVTPASLEDEYEHLH